MNDILIRDAKLKDAKELAILAHALSEYENESSLSSESSIMADAFGESPACRFIVAEKSTSSELAAFAMFYEGYDLQSASKGFHLGDIYVTEEYRGQGIGKLLIKNISQKVSEQNYKWLSWTVSRQNKSARAFYSSLKAHDIDVCFMALGSVKIQEIIK